MVHRALVTGASRGLGKAIAVALAGAGLDVAIAARTLRAGDATFDHSLTVHERKTAPLPGSLEETAAEIEQFGRRALSIRMDLTDLSSVDAGMNELLSTWNHVDVVVHNGRYLGPGMLDTILDTPIEQYPLFLMAHGVAPIRITQLLLPGMLERGEGTVITTSSIAAYDWYPEPPIAGLGYRIGKAAGHSLAGSLQAEYGERGIRAFNIDPGFVPTERYALDGGMYDQAPMDAAPMSVVGAAVAWLVTSPDADAIQRTNVEVQKLVLEKGLHPDWHR